MRRDVTHTWADYRDAIFIAVLFLGLICAFFAALADGQSGTFVHRLFDALAGFRS